VPRFKDACSRTGPSCPIGVYDLAKDPRANEFALRLGIQATPTTVVMDRRGKLHKFVGAIVDSKIIQILKQAVS
jgi:thioredoxin-like negative regulator of GroEL